jgi:stage II sporulation protein D
MPRESRRPQRRAMTAIGAALLAGALIEAASGRLPAGAVEISPLPPSGNITVLGHGNGHGHGMSQYGARGAAIAGLTSAQIVAFYYPGTSRVVLTASTIRVLLSSTGTYPTVSGATKVSGYATALSSTVRYRLVPSSTGFQLQWLSGSSWQAVSGAPLLPAQSDFSSSAGYVRLYRSDGTSADYRGTVGAVRNGTGLLTINRVALDLYTRGVVPRESPSYWEAAALQAQAIAARSYGRFAVEHAGTRAYDICDTDQCQVYGGMARYSSGGTRLFGEETSTNNAVTATANTVLRYSGATIFAQFSASDGGWTVAGGQPYLIAQPDGYDNAASGDPYLNWTRTVPVSSIASYYGLRSVSQIEITSRDGHGQWGGRVLAGYVDGVNSSGAVAHIATTGFGLQSAMGLPHNWFAIQSAQLSKSTGGTTISPTSSSVAMFFRDANNELQDREYVSGAGWAPPANLSAPIGGLTWDPDAATWGDGHMDVAARDSAGHLAIRSFVPGTGWTAWNVRPQIMQSSPGVVSPAASSLYIVYRGASGTLWTLNWKSTSGWSAETQIPGVTNAASGPDAAASVATTKTITVVYRGTDGRMWFVALPDGGSWTAPALVNPTHALPRAAAALDPSVTDTGDGTLGIYYTATDGVVYHSSYSPGTGTWSLWYAIPGTSGATAAPDVSNEGPDHTDVIGGFSGYLRTTTWTVSTGWRAWASLV